MIFPVPPPKPRAHPRHDDVMASRYAIERWEMDRAIRGSARGASAVWVVALCCYAVFGWLALSGLGVPALLVGGLATGLTIAAHRADYPVSDTPSRPRPVALEIVEYSRWENDYLLSRQHEQPFIAFCVCPGCGFADTHQMNPEPCRVPWGNVIRQCSVCRREWAQR